MVRSPWVLIVAALVVAEGSIVSGSGAAQTIHTVDVSLSLSGGVSYGSYQGGVNAGVLDFMRRAQQDQLDSLTEGVRRRFRLRATAGASAGNINAFLSTLAWCAQDWDRPTEGLFWDIWIPTGIEQLLPRDVLHGDLAAFDRTYYERHFRHIRDALKKPPSRHCDTPLPIGITLTRQHPDSMVMGRLAIPVQRFATVFALRANRDFSQSEFATYDARLGEDGSMGMVVRFNDGGTPLHDSVVTNAIVASSAFPAAFAPKRLHYTRVNSLRGRSARESAYFYDGGLFDNNPLALLYDLLGDSANASHADIDETHVIYIDPGRRRERLAASAPKRGMRSEEEPAKHYGLDMLVHMAATAIQPARKYELHALARDMARDPEKQASLRITSRGPPVYGSTYNAFGAFLGRPLREYDFVAGFYDGLLFAVDEWLCTRPASNGSGGDPRLTCSSAERQELLARLVRLYRTEGWVEPRVGALLTALVEDDRGVRTLLPERNAETRQREVERQDAMKRAGARSTVVDSLLLRVVAEAAYELEGREGEDGLAAAFRHIRRSVDLGTLEAIAQTCPWREASDPSSDGCLVDETFLDLVKRPSRELVNIRRHLVRRLWRVADFVGACQDDPTGEGCDEVLPVDGGISPANWERLTEVADWYDAYRTFEWGPRWNPNTVPKWRGWRERTFGWLAPSWASFHVNDNGWNLQASYPIYWSVTESLSLLAPVGGTVWSQGPNVPNVYGLHGGVGLAWQSPWVVALRGGHTWVDNAPNRFFLFGEVFGFGAGVDYSSQNPRETRLFLSLTDVPGLIYALRFVN